MTKITFRQTWQRWARVARKNCVLCKALALVVYPAGATLEVDDETAAEAKKAGVAE